MVFMLGNRLPLKKLLSLCLEHQKRKLLNSKNNELSMVISRSIHSLNQVRLAKDKRLALISNLMDCLDSKVNYSPGLFLRLIACNWVLLANETLPTIEPEGLSDDVLKSFLELSLNTVYLNRLNCSRQHIEEEIHHLIATSQLTY